MYDPPAYLGAITIAGPTAVAALTCIVLYGGAERAGLGRRRPAHPLSCSPASSWPPSPTSKPIRLARLYAGRGPGQRKETQ